MFHPPLGHAPHVQPGALSSRRADLSSPRPIQVTASALPPLPYASARSASPCFHCSCSARCAEPLSPRLSQVTASARREWLSSIAVFLPRRCLLAVSGVVCPAVPCEFTAAPRAVCSWVGCLLAAPTRPRRSSQATASVFLSPRFPTLAPLASPDAPCSYALLVMAACVYGCTAYIPQLGALRPRRADPSSSRSRQARRADLSSPPSSQATASVPLHPLPPPPRLARHAL